MATLVPAIHTRGINALSQTEIMGRRDKPGDDG